MIYKGYRTIMRYEGMRTGGDSSLSSGLAAIARVYPADNLSTDVWLHYPLLTFFVNPFFNIEKL